MKNNPDNSKAVAVGVSYTDCRDQEGVTVGLVDAIITLCRVLRQRDLSGDTVKEALKDLSYDEDFLYFCHRR